MKKVVVFGGGTGLSCLLSGLKLFPMDVTTVITVSDNGSSTGVLKEELDIPAVGDVGKVLLAMANVDEDFVKLLRYRFQKEGTLRNHPVRNILLAALIDLKGSLSEATKYMCGLLNVKGTVLPLSEERVDLVGERTTEGKPFFGEEAVSQDITEKIGEADLIIFSPGSLYTSILPHLIAPEVRAALAAAEAPLMYVSNLVTQPGETDDYMVGDHVEVLNSYLQGRKIDVVIANDGAIDDNTVAKYLKTENKKIVQIDRERLGAMGCEVRSADIFDIDEAGSIRHNALDTAYQVFSYLMERK